jgi:hypothetical protein
VDSEILKGAVTAFAESANASATVLDAGRILGGIIVSAGVANAVAGVFFGETEDNFMMGFL